jgi:hypothetical protein
LVTFEKGQRKDDVAAAYRKRSPAGKVRCFIGKAQEKTPVFCTERAKASGLRYQETPRQAVGAAEREFTPLRIAPYRPSGNGSSDRHSR